MHRAEQAGQSGFTLIELATVVAIIGILATIAFPSYQRSIEKSRRAEGKSTVQITAQALERCFTQFGTYNNSNCTITTTAFNSTPKAYYRVQVRFCTSNPATAACTAAASGTATSFFITATAQNQQISDTRCATLTLNSTGTRGATGTDSANCW